MAKQKKKSSQKPKYKSGFEANFGAALEKLGIPFGYEAKKVKYVKEHTYNVDFTLESGILIETKGYFKAIDRTKMLAVKKLNPELDIRLIFMGNNKIHKLSTTRYGDWCDKHGFKWAISKDGSVPKEWLKELLKNEDTGNGSRRVSRKSPSRALPKRRA